MCLTVVTVRFNTTKIIAISFFSMSTMIWKLDDWKEGNIDLPTDRRFFLLDSSLLMGGFIFRAAETGDVNIAKTTTRPIKMAKSSCPDGINAILFSLILVWNSLEGFPRSKPKSLATVHHNLFLFNRCTLFSPAIKETPEMNQQWNK